MKILTTILLVLLVLVTLLGVGLQMFLTRGMTTTLNGAIFPALKSMYGLELAVDNASVNLLQGTAELDGLTIRNLKGYEKPMLFTFETCRFELELSSLIHRDPIIIKRAEALGAVLTIERNQERHFNIKELADALKPIESTDAPTAPHPAQEKAATLPIHIRRIAVDATVLYADTKRNHEYPLNLRLTGSDLFTVPATGQPNSLLVLRGSLADKENSVVTDLSAIVEPLTDLTHPSFNATGSILDIDAEFIKDLLQDNDMESGPFSLKPSLVCKRGELQGSALDITLTRLKVYGSDIGDTTLNIPISGTLQDRKYDITGALQSLFSKQSINIIKSIGLKELGLNTTEQPADALMQGITNSVKEIADSPNLQKLIQQVVPGTQSSDPTPSAKPVKETLSDALFEQLEKNVDEVEPRDTEALKGLFNNLLGK